eukprot:scpid92190/ scgid8043/ 
MTGICAVSFFRNCTLLCFTVVPLPLYLTSTLFLFCSPFLSSKVTEEIVAIISWTAHAQIPWKSVVSQEDRCKHATRPSCTLVHNYQYELIIIIYRPVDMGRSSVWPAVFELSLNSSLAI